MFHIKGTDIIMVISYFDDIVYRLKKIVICSELKYFIGLLKFVPSIDFKRFI